MYLKKYLEHFLTTWHGNLHPAFRTYTRAPPESTTGSVETLQRWDEQKRSSHNCGHGTWGDRPGGFFVVFVGGIDRLEWWPALQIVDLEALFKKEAQFERYLK